jgi:hypothetical protein
VKIAFATSCMNRRWQLEYTLASNLRVLADTPHSLALCDYHSGDHVGHLVEELADFVGAGTLVYFRTTEPSSFHMSLAKNTAHRLALRGSPDVVFNLDADNRVTRETIELVERVFGADPDACLHNWDLDPISGTCGRIALAAQRWCELGGYDEELLPMGWQDIDLLTRARAIGLRYLRDQAGLSTPVRNSYGDKLANLHLPEGVEADSGRDLYSRLVHRNLVTSLSRPVRLRIEDQRRFQGQLNFAETVTI